VAERHLGNRGAARLDDGRQQGLMLARIDLVMAAGEHGDGAALDRGAVGGLIDATRQTRDDDKTGLAEIARQLAGEFQAGAGGIARADDRDHRPHRYLQRAAQSEQGRRIVEHGEPRRIAGFIRRQQADAEPHACGKLSARILLAANPRRTISAAAPRQIGQPFQGGARVAEMKQQGIKGARPDIVGADQPQPVDPLGVGEGG
jgi:hypothetical protein